MAALARDDWPGNIRELRNVVRRAAILTTTHIDTAALELPAPATARFPVMRAGEPALRLRLAEVDGGGEEVLVAEAAAPVAPAAAPLPNDTLPIRGRTFAEIERDLYSWSLREHGGSRRRAAKALSIARSTFCEKVKKYGLA
jgi:DNA-binding NtrC family response regulator